MLIRTCIVSDSPELGERVERILRQPDVIVSVLSGGTAWERAAQECSDLVIAASAAVPRPFKDSVAALRTLADGPELVVLSEDGRSEGRAAFQAAGAFAVVDRDLPDASLRKALNTIIRRRRETLLGRLRAARPPEEELQHALDTRSPRMRELLSLAERVAGSDSSLLVVGETGVGKEWLARWVHARSPRADGPFLAVNCAALPGELVESELFGHEQGAFTGAHRARRGQFELAHHGTLFLDEVAEMALAAQAKLLRAIQDREVRPVGGERPIRVDVRIVAATNREPEAAVRSKQLREDLFYRLGVVTLEVPPLRDRPEDVPPLVKEYLEELRLRLGRLEIREVSPPVLRALQAYAWPGNVRELMNVLERAVLLSAGPALTLDDIPLAISGAAPGHDGSAADDWRPRPGWDRFWEPTFGLPLTEARAAVVDEYEREYLRRLLEQVGGRVGEAARQAGIDERTLYNKMRRYGMEKERFRERVL